jgi:uncharacterized protein
VNADPGDIIKTLRLQPLPVEGGLFVQTWRSDDDPRPAGTATYAAFTGDADSFSAIHRLPVDEIWHFYLGDPVELILLHQDGSHSVARIGSDILNGESPQLMVSRGTWFGGGLVEGGSFCLFGNTMAPGFYSGCYEGGVRADLLEQWPHAADYITRYTRLSSPTRMPEGL